MMNGRIYIIVYINIISVVEFQKQDFWQKLNESSSKVGDDFRNKGCQKLMLSKKYFDKSCAPKRKKTLKNSDDS